MLHAPPSATRATQTFDPSVRASHPSEAPHADDRSSVAIPHVPPARGTTHVCEVSSQTSPAGQFQCMNPSQDCPCVGMARHTDVAALVYAHTSSGRHITSGEHARPVERVVRQFPVSRPASLHVVAMHAPPLEYVV